MIQTPYNLSLMQFMRDNELEIILSLSSPFKEDGLHWRLN